MADAEFPVEGCALDERVSSLLDHVNQDHHADLVACVARSINRAPGIIAAAWLTELDALGGEVRWVDPTGARSAELCFAQEAQCQHHLAELLGAELTTGRLLFG